MKTLYYSTWGKLEMEDLPLPSIGEGEVLLRVFACGICGSELETFKNASTRRTPPLILGHEFCGQVEEVYGEDPGGLRGRRMIPHAVVHCGQCPACLRGDTNLCYRGEIFGMHRPGAFAEYVAVPERVLIPWPENLSPDAAIFSEPLANGINALRQGRTTRRSKVAVIGAGPIGLMCLFAAKTLYESSVVISDRLPERLAAGQLLGADRTVNPAHENLESECEKLWGGERPEYVIDAVGSAQTKQLALDLVEPGGTVVWVGLHENTIQLQSYAVTLRQKCVAGSYSGSLVDLRQAAQILSEGKLETSWVFRCPVEEGEAAFMDLLRPDTSKIKVVLRY